MLVIGPLPASEDNLEHEEGAEHEEHAVHDLPLIALAHLSPVEALLEERAACPGSVAVLLTLLLRLLLKGLQPLF